MMEVGGIFALVILFFDIFAIISVIGSSATTGAKVLWVLLVLFLPLLGLVIWFALGPRSSNRI